MVERLDAEGLLPAIMFIFSRKGCDAAVQQCLSTNLRLTNAAERDEIRAFAEAKAVGHRRRRPGGARLSTTGSRR